MLGLFKRRLLIGGAIAVGLLILFMFFSIRVHLDLGFITFGVAAIVLAFGVYSLILYFIKPKKTVTVITKVSFISPPVLMRTVQTYKLKIEMHHQIEEKGKISDHKLDQLELSFNRSDHPDVYQYCFGIVSEILEKNLISAEKKYPDANVIPGPLSLPGEIKRLAEKNS